jgi:hypothetical protein
MKSIIHQPFGYVLYLDTRGGFEGSEIEYELVGNPASCTPIKNRVVVGEAFGEIVSV